MEFLEEQIKIGWIEYANAVPIYYFFNKNTAHLKNIISTYGVPTNINQQLIQNQIQVANISAVEFIKNKNTLMLLPFCISATKKVFSVGIFHTKPIEKIKNIALTSQSATSVALLKILLKINNISPVLKLKEGDTGELLKDYDAVLKIGDDALKDTFRFFSWQDNDFKNEVSVIKGQKIYFSDLCTLWYNYTKMPFVFAVWACQKDFVFNETLRHVFQDSCNEGSKNLEFLAKIEAKRLNLPLEMLLVYLKNFDYQINDEQNQALSLFERYLTYYP